VLVYSDDILILGYMKEFFQKKLLTEIEKIYNNYGLYLNKEKTIINRNPKNPITFLGLEFYESKKYKITAKQRQKSKIRIRANKENLINKLLEKRLLMVRGEISPYNTRDTSKHQKNVLKKKLKIFNKRTTWCISEKYKPLH
jgi:CRISPR/Cas system CMR-associated protein Cmr5 small subunit